MDEVLEKILYDIKSNLTRSSKTEHIKVENILELKNYIKNIKTKWIDEHKSLGDHEFYVYYALDNVSVICDKFLIKILDNNFEPEKRKKYHEWGIKTEKPSEPDKSPIISDMLYILTYINQILNLTSNSEIQTKSIPEALFDELVVADSELVSKAERRNLFPTLTECKESLSDDFVKKYNEYLESLVVEEPDVVMTK